MVSFLSRLINVNGAFLVIITSFYWFIVSLIHRATKTPPSARALILDSSMVFPRSQCLCQKIIPLILPDIRLLALIWSLFFLILPSIAVDLSEEELRDRCKNYEIASKYLTSLENEDLLKLLQHATQMWSKWGTAASTNIVIEKREIPIFIKTIPLTEKEAHSERSTENLFDLPLYYQYGVGSAGFGVWRELSAYLMGTNWALAGECPNFPLVYHWCVLPRSPLSKLLLSEQEAELERKFIYWDRSIPIRTFLEERGKASSMVVIFMEYIPETLEGWLDRKFSESGNIAESDIAMVDSNLRDITNFINSHDMLHFDMGFRNILTDGKRLYLADFGLALSLSFNLSSAEQDFFERHRNYDKYCTTAHLVNWLVVNLYGEEKFKEVLQEYAKGRSPKKLAPLIQSIITRYAPIAIIMDDFFRKLRADKKTTPFPAAKLAEIFR